MSKLFFIPLSVPSSKNGRSTFNGFAIASKQTQRWRKATQKLWQELKEQFAAEIQNRTLPLLIGIHFVRDSARRYDFVNPIQTIQDEMVKHELLSDDNTDIMYPVPMRLGGRLSTRNPDNPGVYIKILNSLCEAEQVDTPVELIHQEPKVKPKQSKHENKVAKKA